VKKIEAGRVIIKDKTPRVSEFEVAFGTNVLAKNGAFVAKGQRLTEGHINLGRLMEIAGILKAQEYIVDEIKSIYASQGQTVNSKHIELIVRQMFSRVRILDKGDSEFFP
jgi:DNA-directed RNA polymerase subunit beta'